MIARGEAIEQYADLENVLCLLFGYLLGVKPNLASIVFFRITNARARNSIIEKLMTEVIKKNDYRIYWNSLIKMTGELDGTRNAIVHWQTNWEMRFDEKGLVKKNVFGLAPRRLGGRPAPSEEWLDERRLKAFVAKVYFVSTSITTFLTIFNAGRDHRVNEREAWLQIFPHKAVYPPPETHPIFQRPGAREVLLPASEGSPPLPEAFVGPA